MIGFSIGIGVGGGGRLRFLPSAIFTASEPGAWYDPSDLTTLFQDSAGATPVTTAGQTVGKMLDKSQGLVLGSELVTNGDFTDPVTTGWTASGSAVLSVVSGRLRVTNGATLTGGATYVFSTVAGRSYKWTYFVDAATSGGVVVRARDNTTLTVLQTATFTTSGSYSVIFVAQGSTTQIQGVNTSNTLGIYHEFDNISVRELPGNHATQATLAQRPTYQVDGTGRPYISFDGVDDGMVTGTITPAIDKVQVFAGVRKLSDAAAGFVVELSTSSTSSAGSFGLLAPSASLNDFQFRSGGTNSGITATAAGYSSPTTRVLTGIGNISGDLAALRIDGSQVATSATDQGTGNYLAYPLYIGRRAGTSFPFNGRIYSLIVRFGANLTAGQIASTEAYVNGKTGAY